MNGISDKTKNSKRKTATQKGDLLRKKKYDATKIPAAAATNNVIAEEILEKSNDEMLQFIEDGMLTPKEMLFVNYFTGSLNSSRPGSNNTAKPWNCRAAAIAAGYDKTNIDQTAHRLVNKPAIKEMIKNRLKAHMAIGNLQTNEILRQYASVAFLNPKNYFRPDGNIKSLDELTDDQAFAVSSLEVQEGKVKLRFWDKLKALDTLVSVVIKAGLDLTLTYCHEERTILDLENLSAEELSKLYQEMVRKP